MSDGVLERTAKRLIQKQMEVKIGELDRDEHQFIQYADQLRGKEARALSILFSMLNMTEEQRQKVLQHL